MEIIFSDPEFRRARFVLASETQEPGPAPKEHGVPGDPGLPHRGPQGLPEVRGVAESSGALDAAAWPWDLQAPGNV